MEYAVYTIVLLPLLAFVIGSLFGKQLGDKEVIKLSCGAVTISAVLSLIVFIHIGFNDGAVIYDVLYNWISVGHLNINFGLLVDKLTVTMLFVVTSVSACVHYYSIGYMAHDEAKGRFFSYLSLFTFTMLALVTAPNLAQMFLGWEGVGLASYLLIGFWHHKESANKAAVKAFVVNRVADLGLLLAIFTTFIVFGSLDYQTIFSGLEYVNDFKFNFFGMDINLISLIAIFLFIGAMGKSAQFGFHVWLPDAMEGPTPVSALIHAATMVTAGVFLLARMSPLFELSGDVMTLIAWVGAITAIFAATVGLVQTDIKRVIAYSTCSQLGYMFFACGVGAYSAAIFHLTTHAFFKALLFLGAGSIIHALQDEQDMTKMGGLRKLLPATYIFMWIGSLALMGIPPFAGFFSKDLILESAFMANMGAGGNGEYLYYAGVAAAFMTAFYSLRLIFRVFHMRTKASKEVMKKAHDAPLVMLIPMAVLAVGAVFSGIMLHSMGDVEWWNGAIVTLTDIHHGIKDAHHTPTLYKLLPLLVVISGGLLAYRMYISKPMMARRMAKKYKFIYKLVLNKWFIDELYQKVILKPVNILANFLWQRGDVKGIDFLLPNGVAVMVKAGAKISRKMQTGYVFHYAFAIVLGVLGFITWVIIKEIM